MAARLDIENKISALKYDNCSGDITINMHIFQFNRLVYEYTIAGGGDELTNARKCEWFVRSVTAPELRPFRFTLANQLSQDFLTITYAFRDADADLRTDNAQRVTQETALRSNIPNESQGSSSRYQGRRDNTNRPPMKCWNCDKPGHRALECRSKQRNQKGGQGQNKNNLNRNEQDSDIRA